MSGVKRLMEENEERAGTVIARLEDAGAFSRCEIHETLIDNDDAEAVDAVRTELADEFGEEEADDMIEAAQLEAGEECYACANNMAKG